MLWIDCFGFGILFLSLSSSSFSTKNLLLERCYQTSRLAALKTQPLFHRVVHRLEGGFILSFYK